MQSQYRVRVGRELSIPFPILPATPEVHQFLYLKTWEWSLIPPFSFCSKVPSISQCCQFPQIISQIHPRPLRPSSYPCYNIATCLSLFDHSSLLTAVPTLSPALLQVALHSAVRINFYIIRCWRHSPTWNPPKTFQCISTVYRAMYALTPALYHQRDLFLSPLHSPCPATFT